MGFEGGLRRKIVGQDEAVQAVVDLYQVFRAGLHRDADNAQDALRASG